MGRRRGDRLFAHRGGDPRKIMKQLAAVRAAAKVVLKLRRLLGRSHLVGKGRNQLVGVLVLCALHEPVPRMQSRNATRARASLDRTVPTATPSTSAISS